MKLYELIKIIENKYPSQLQEEWDNSGLQIGDYDCDVTGVAIGLDVTLELIELAIKKGYNTIITHHPLLFNEIKCIENDYLSKRIKKAIKNNINIFSCHTNYDKVDMHKICADKIGITSTEYINNMIGIVGKINEMSVDELANLVKDRFEIPYVKVFGDKDKLVKKVAILPGSGKSEISSVIKLGADVYITGDIDYHSALDAIGDGIALIDAGHRGLEHIFVQNFKEFLECNTDNIEIATEENCYIEHIL